MVVLVDKMLKTQIIECSAVANWIFSKDMMAEFTKAYVWEMLNLTIRYCRARISADFQNVVCLLIMALYLTSDLRNVF